MMFVYSALLALINRRLLPEPIRVRGVRLVALGWSFAPVRRALGAHDRGPAQGVLTRPPRPPAVAGPLRDLVCAPRRKGSDRRWPTSSSSTRAGSCRFPPPTATEGPSGLDVGALLKETGYVTLDPGFVNTASCASAITFIDGDEGILRYRGYPIDQLAEQSSFLEVVVPADLRRAADGQPSSRRSATGSGSTRCCTRRCAGSSTASRATRTRWRCCPRRSARCRPSTRTASTRSTATRSRSRRSG